MNNNDLSNISLIKQFYETATESEIRGKISNEAIYAYALYVLDRIQLSKGRVLDVGCGDGKIMAAIKSINPYIDIDGIELSESLSKKAKALNPSSEIYNVNALDSDISHRYDRIFSFGFVQYLNEKLQLELNLKLNTLLNEMGGEKIVHLSIPDFGLKNAAIYVEYAKKGRLWRFPIRYFLNIFNRSRKYGIDGGMYHCPMEILNLHKDIFQVTLNRESDFFYRFDYELRKHD